jgi:hypothetical protein
LWMKPRAVNDVNNNLGSAGYRYKDAKLYVMLDEELLGSMPIPQASFPTAPFRFVVDLKEMGQEVRITQKRDGYVPWVDQGELDDA